MQSPTPETRTPKLVSHTHYCVMGDVTVANSAAIAPGVVLQASPGSRIVISEGACLAGGVCIQSRQGVLTIGAGANLGANVLIVGSGAIGENACISPGSTVVDPQVEAGALIAPASLVVAAKAPVSSNTAQSAAQSSTTSNGKGRFSAGNGFTSGSYLSNPAGFVYSSTAPQSASAPVNNAVTPPSFTNGVSASNTDDTYRNTFVEPPPVGPKPIQVPSLSDQNGQYVDPSAQTNDVQFRGGNRSAITVRSNDRVYGKDQVSQLLSTLFPHRQT